MWFPAREEKLRESPEPHRRSRNSTYKKQSVNPGVTEFVEIKSGGHSLTIDSGWRDVAQISLDFIRRFV
jgi:hypothetical protein